MKSLNKKLYAVIIISLLLLCFSVSALANNGTNLPDNTQSNVSTSSGGSGTNNDNDTNSDNNSNAGNDNDTDSDTGNGSGNENNSNAGSDTESDNNTGSDGQSSETSSDLSNNSEDSSSGDTSSGLDNSSDTASSNDVSSGMQNTTSYYSNNSQNSYYNDFDGTVSDGEVGDWTDKKPVVSVGTTEKVKKNVGEGSLYYLLLTIFIVSVVLLAVSISALVFVNRKAFLKEDFNDNNTPKKQKPNATEKAKRKNNHKNRTNIYRPRD